MEPHNNEKKMYKLRYKMNNKPYKVHITVNVPFHSQWLLVQLLQMYYFIAEVHNLYYTIINNIDK